MSLVELPIELQDILISIIGIGVVFILTELSKLLKADLSGYAAQVTAAVWSAVFVVIKVLLAKIPEGFEGIAAAVLQLLVVLLGAFGLYGVYRQKFPKAK